MIFSASDLLGMTLSEITKLFGVNELGTIEQIEEDTYAEFRENGFSIVLTGDKPSTIFLYSDGYEGYREFKHQIENDISFNTPRKKIREMLGTPTISNDSPKKSDLGDIPMWDRYEFQNHSVHFQYGMEDDSHIEMISIMRPEKKIEF